ncbi:hypothetical protein DFH07DRAFT_774746 [Mycena maculata]|uniref:Uncharacterized protein n=1 Tax=Mycena maculata TaxID=230809 RepID=A0AAD7IXP8_9AGAR|nr:hypothetical protein DFH07DRAFT_774746 [Mycena maculata]
MVQRIYALYSCDKGMVWCLTAIATVLMIIILSTIVVGTKPALVLPILGALRMPCLAGAWGALFVFDTIIFALTIYNAYSTRGRMGTMPLHKLIFRDGAMYFAAMALANLANIITFMPLIPGTLATFASCVSVTMVSRLMLNIHKQVDVDQPSPDLGLSALQDLPGSASTVDGASAGPYAPQDILPV